MGNTKKRTTNILKTASFDVRMSLILENGVDRPYIGRALRLLALDLIQYPIKVYERAITSQKSSSHEITQGPIFVIGFWRSGTTHLHNILCNDPQFGYPSLFHTVFPQTFVTYEKMGMKRVLSRLLPATRPQDNVSHTFDGPMECEIGLANISRHSFAHSFSFPRSYDTYFNRYILFKDISDREKQTWKRQYYRFLKKVSQAQDHRMLLLKSPYHTARIPLLREMFPDAYYIFIYRNPYEIFYSTVNAILSWQEGMLFQNPLSREALEDAVLYWYNSMMTAYHAQKDAISPNKLTEIRFEDLINHPLQEIEKVYSKLNLPSFSVAKPYFESYIIGQSDYQRNTYNYSEEMLSRIESAWGKWIQCWSYDRPK